MFGWMDGCMDGWKCACLKKKSKLIIKCNEYEFDKNTLIKLGTDIFTMYRIVGWYSQPDHL